jgi:heme-degrading monooxygenase HmoA
MITRTWHGRTSLQNADNYLYFLLHEGTKEYLQTAGNLSVKVWQHKERDCCHFWTVTEWRDIESIKSFAGEDYEKAKYYPQDEGILLEFEEKVNHYETYSVSL